MIGSRWGSLADVGGDRSVTARVVASMVAAMVSMMADVVIGPVASVS
jgi:hypothetical protein